MTTVRIADITNQIRGVSYKPSDVKDGQMNGAKPILRANNITPDGLVFDDLVWVDEKVISKHQLLQQFDILIAASSGSKSVIGKASQLSQSWEGSFGAFCKVLRPKIEKVDPKYLYYFFQTKEYRTTVSALAAGANINNLRNEHLDNLQILLPPLPIQKKIAAILDKADNVRQKDKQLIEHYNKLAQSIFYDMFGDPVGNAKGWDKQQLSSVCVQITDGTHFSPPPSNSGAPYITAKHLKLSGLDFYSDPTYVSFEEHQKIFARCRPEKGDVLYIKDGATTGIAAINHYDFEFSMLSSLALIKPDWKKLNNYYLKSWLNHEKVKENLIQNYMAGAAIKRFTLSKINVFEIPLPPLPLQSEFKRKIEKIESCTSIVLKSYKQSYFLFQGLLQKAFKGELVKEP